MMTNSTSFLSRFHTPKNHNNKEEGNKVVRSNHKKLAPLSGNNSKLRRRFLLFSSFKRYSKYSNNNNNNNKYYLKNHISKNERRLLLLIPSSPLFSSSHGSRWITGHSINRNYAPETHPTHWSPSVVPNTDIANVPDTDTHIDINITAPDLANTNRTFNSAQTDTNQNEILPNEEDAQNTLLTAAHQNSAFNRNSLSGSTDTNQPNVSHLVPHSPTTAITPTTAATEYIGSATGTVNPASTNTNTNHQNDTLSYNDSVSSISILSSYTPPYSTRPHGSLESSSTLISSSDPNMMNFASQSQDLQLDKIDETLEQQQQQQNHEIDSPTTPAISNDDFVESYLSQPDSQPTSDSNAISTLEEEEEEQEERALDTLNTDTNQPNTLTVDDVTPHPQQSTNIIITQPLKVSNKQQQSKQHIQPQKSALIDYYDLHSSCFYKSAELLSFSENQKYDRNSTTNCQNSQPHLSTTSLTNNFMHDETENEWVPPPHLPQSSFLSSSNNINSPIYHPNEVLLQRFPNKMSMKRVSEIRIHLKNLKLKQEAHAKKLQLEKMERNIQLQKQLKLFKQQRQLSESKNTKQGLRSKKDKLKDKSEKDGKKNSQFRKFSDKTRKLQHFLFMKRNSSSSSESSSSEQEFSSTNSTDDSNINSNSIFSNPDSFYASSSSSSTSMVQSASSLSTSPNSNSIFDFSPSAFSSSPRTNTTPGAAPQSPRYHRSNSSDSISPTTSNAIPNTSNDDNSLTIGDYIFKNLEDDEDDENDFDLLKEYSHTYLSRGQTKGSLYITSERLIFIPKNKNSLAASTEEAEFSINIIDIDTMKIVQSNKSVVGTNGSSYYPWYFVCYEDFFVCTIPFKSKNRAWSFLKLLSNIRFELKIKIHLPPRYGTSMKVANVSNRTRTVIASAITEACENFPSADNHSNENNGHIGSSASAAPLDTTDNNNDNVNHSLNCVSNCLSLSLANIAHVKCFRCHNFHHYNSWVVDDNHLPTYEESEFAVGCFLVELKLLEDPAIFDRMDPNINPSSLLSRACAPPYLDYLNNKQVENPLDYAIVSNGTTSGNTANDPTINDINHSSSIGSNQLAASSLPASNSRYRRQSVSNNVPNNSNQLSPPSSPIASSQPSNRSNNSSSILPPPVDPHLLTLSFQQTQLLNTLSNPILHHNSQYNTSSPSLAASASVTGAPSLANIANIINSQTGNGNRRLQLNSRNSRNSRFRRNIYGITTGIDGSDTRHGRSNSYSNTDLNRLSLALSPSISLPDSSASYSRHNLNLADPTTLAYYTAAANLLQSSTSASSPEYNSVLSTSSGGNNFSCSSGARLDPSSNNNPVIDMLANALTARALRHQFLMESGPP